MQYPFQIGAIDNTRTNNEFQYQTSNKYSPGSWETLRGRGYVWGVSSNGPRLDGIGGFRNLLRGAPNNLHRIYDSTNGTKSAGFIIRTNKGAMETLDLSPEVP